MFTLTHHEFVNGGRERELHIVLLDDTRIGGDRPPPSISSLDDGRPDVEVRGEVSDKAVHACRFASKDAKTIKLIQSHRAAVDHDDDDDADDVDDVDVIDAAA